MRTMWVKIPSVHPVPEAVAERRMHFIVDEDDDGSSPFGLATFIFDKETKHMFALKSSTDVTDLAT